MPDLCTDNRFELIDKYRQRLVQATNIAMNLDEMKVLDSILFRFWQMGWLDRLEEEKHGRWVPLYDDVWVCSECEQAEQFAGNIESTSRYCPNCGARMDGGAEDEAD